MLCIEVGNSRTKWRLVTGENLIEGSFWSEDCKSGYRELKSAMVADVGSVWLASVASDGVTAALVEYLRHDMCLMPHLVKVERECLGLSVSYPVLSHLGVDRWLAMLAAWQDCGSACCVVDVGTAINVEFVSAAGRQLGGLIAPGSYAMMRALFNDTHAVKPSAVSLSRQWSPQNDTLDCVEHGISAMLVGMFQQILERCKALDVATLYLAGGDAGLFGNLAVSDGVGIRQSSGLVLDGLQLYANQRIKIRE